MAHRFIFFSLIIPTLVLGQSRYALILEDSPALQSGEAQSYRRQVEAKQRALRNELASRNIAVTGAVSSLLNAVFVTAPRDRLPELQSLSGVKGVVAVRRYKRDLNRATQLLNAPAAWNALNGVGQAGAGVKIAILDSGIDNKHPAFQDSSLPMPAGFPICSGSDCAYTSNKVIVARSYVRQLAAGTSPNPAADSRPDDYSARDRSGHGTAVASCAAGVQNTGVVAFTGMAPKAYLGNYKIYGSPEVNDYTTDDVIILALEDALHDGMDIVSFSSGGSAFTGPLDSGATCGNASGVPCDLSAAAFENAARMGLVIVSAAGNEGYNGVNYPTFNSISSPGDAPSIITVGATTNSHTFAETVSVPGAGVPSNLQGIIGNPGDGYIPTGAVTAPLVDVASVGNDGLGCSALPAESLLGAIALIKRGSCNFSVKIDDAYSAGAEGVIFYMADQSALISPTGLSNYPIPALMISNTDGVNLKSFIAANPGHAAVLDAAGAEQDASPFNELVYFSSFGPSTGDSAIKPDLVAVGTNMYMAMQSYDPLGDMYSSNGYGVADGTSFATPLVSGAAALVKQKHPSFTAAQIKSALVNATSQDVTTDDSGLPVDVEWLGAGKLDAGAAVNATVTSNPATLSFGAVKSGSLPKTLAFTITNSGTSAATLALAIMSTRTGAALALDQTALTLAAGASGVVTATLSGSVPAAGSYSGVVTVQGASASLRIPFMYIVGDGVVANLIPLTGDYNDGTVGAAIPDGILSFKLVDSYGLPVAGVPVTFSTRGAGKILNPAATTNAFGIATAQAVLGPTVGTYTFTAAAGAMRYTFTEYARPQPTINAGGVVNAASLDQSPVAPGSYVTIFGAGLSDSTNVETSASLPLAIDYVNVSFDVPTAGLSVPARPIFVSPGQVNIQLPWELQGQTSAQAKVTIDFSNGNVVTVPISDYSPAFFEGTPGAAAALDVNYRYINAANPAVRGQVIQLYCNGLGPVTNQPATGEPAPLSPLAETTSTPVVMIGGQQAAVAFSGLTPGLPGLYQINVTVPVTVTPGVNPITVSIGGKTSKTSALSVQ